MMASASLSNGGVGSSRSINGFKSSSSSVDWLGREMLEMRLRDKVEHDDDQDSDLDIIDGVGAEAGHVIRTTVGGRNGQSRQTINYIAEHVVGTGSFGTVFQAKCRETGEIVAIKKVLQDKRYKNRELQIMQMLDHPNIVGLKHSFFSTTNKEELYLNLVLEYVPETLNRIARNYNRVNQRMPLIYVKLYTYQICRALAFMHNCVGICHRDIKPQNLLVNPHTHQLKLCDFGSAKVLVKGEANVSYICSRYYRAPELIFGVQKCTELQEVRELHAQFVVSGLIHNHKIAPKRLIQAYVKTSNVGPAISIFETSILSPDVFVYNTIIRGLITHDDDCPARALLYYNRLLLHPHQPDNYTYTFVLKACSRLLHNPLFVGKQVHNRIIKAGVSPNTYVHSSLIHMYATSGCMEDAERVLGEFGDEENVDATNSIISGYCRVGRVDEARAKFDGMRDKDVASWSAMVNGYTQNEMHMEALFLFHYMTVIDPEILPNESMLVSLLTTCGCVGALAQGRWIHKYIDRVGIKNTATLSTAMVDMYAKCGSIECSYGMFKKMATRDRDVVSWGAMISGFAIHGQATKCLQLFDEMIAYGIRPNVVIFVAVLTACSRSGLVEKGQQYFQEMVHRFKITPTIEHYGCMVDMLARIGRLEESQELIESMPEQANSVILRAFLSGCRIHNDIGRASWAFRKLMEVEPLSGDMCKMGELMFASAGRQKEATKIRRIMNAAGMERTAGCSFIEVDGTVHQFIAGDIMHSQTEEIYRMCSTINTSMGRPH